MDIASVAGVLLAIVGVLGGMLLEGVSLRQVAQPTALLIVLGGTLGAVMVQFPLAVVWAAAREMVHVFLAPAVDDEAAVAQMVVFAMKARRSGVISLEPDLEGIGDDFLRRAMTLAVDGVSAAELRMVMEMDLDRAAEDGERVPQVLEAAGGFAPTVGILGAVLGLIQVMQHLGNIEEVGRGIAVAFVATIYGVGLANLVCLPIAGKMKLRERERQRAREMMVEGVAAIVEGVNPRMIEARLRTFVQVAEGKQERGVHA